MGLNESFAVHGAQNPLSDRWIVSLKYELGQSSHCIPASQARWILPGLRTRASTRKNSIILPNSNLNSKNCFFSTQIKLFEFIRTIFKLLKRNMRSLRNHLIDQHASHCMGKMSESDFGFENSESEPIERSERHFAHTKGKNLINRVTKYSLLFNCDHNTDNFDGSLLNN